MKTTFFYLSAFVLLFSCSAEKQNDTLTTQEAYNFFQSLSGDWAMQPTEDALEIWDNTADNVVGHGIAVNEKGDSLITEAYFLEIVNDSLRFQVQPITDEGFSKSIDYFLTRATANKFVFENPKHNFPKKMTYVFKKNQYQVFLEGEIDGFSMQSDLLFKRN